jgi:transcription initiation factor TFIIF subunit alpha
MQEYNVRPSNSSDKSYFIGRFVQGLPAFSKKKGCESKWSLHKEGLKGRQLTDALRVALLALSNFVFSCPLHNKI